MNTPASNGSPKWAALIEDRVVPLPRQKLRGRVIKQQAGLGDDVVLVRDYQSPNDVPIGDEEEVDLAEGNVFRVVQRCNIKPDAKHCGGVPKFAFFVDDVGKITLNPKQTEDSLRGLFDLKLKVQLLRDLESPNDTPIADNETVSIQDGPVFISAFDLETHCGCDVPHAGGYIIKVDKQRIVVRESSLTAREILKRVGKNAVEWLLNQKIGKQFVPLAPDDIVDFTKCGIERFTTLPNEQSEGRPAPRRQFTLPEADTEALDASGLVWETIKDGGNCWVIVHGLQLPPELTQQGTSVAIQIPASYPDAALDMAHFYPHVKRVDGSAIAATGSGLQIEGTPWQQWSRHYTAANPWVSGEFNVFTHFLLCQSWLQREANKGK